MTSNRNIVMQRLTPCLCVLWAANILMAQPRLPDADPAQASTSRPAGNTVRQVEFKDVPLAEAVRLLGRQTGLNLVASQEAGKAKVCLFLQDVSPKAVVEELCRANNLWYRQDETTGIVRIMTVQEFQRDLTAFREEQTQVFAVLYPNAVSTATAIKDLYGDRVHLSLGTDDESDMTQDITARLNRFDLIDQRSQGLGLSNPSSGTTGTNVSQYGSGSQYGGGYQSVGTGYGSAAAARQAQTNQPANAESEALRELTPAQAEALSKALKDQTTSQDQQALLDAFRKKQANIYVRVIRRNNLIVVRTGDQTVLQEIAKLVQRLDVPTPTVLLEVKVLSIALSDDFSSVFDYQFSNGSGVAGQFSTGNIAPPASDLVTGAAQKFASMVPGGTGLQSQDLIFQFVSENFRARMQLLEGKNRVTELATPLLLTANNEVSRLFVGQQYPIVQGIGSQVSQNQTGAITSSSTPFTYVPVGTTLLMTPSINADRTVTLRILQENSQVITGGANIPVITSNGNVVSQPIDIVSTRTLSGTIVAKDGLMLAVGGLIDESVTDKRSEVPVLGKIPGLGFFFRRQETGRSRNELIIMVRPHVLNTPAESQAISQDLMKTLSIHPAATQPSGDLGTYKADEVLRPNLPKNECDSIFRFHSVKPADY